MYVFMYVCMCVDRYFSFTLVARSSCVVVVILEKKNWPQKFAASVFWTKFLIAATDETVEDDFSAKTYDT